MWTGPRGWPSITTSTTSLPGWVTRSQYVAEPPASAIGRVQTSTVSRRGIDDPVDRDPCPGVGGELIHVVRLVRVVVDLGQQDDLVERGRVGHVVGSFPRQTATSGSGSESSSCRVDFSSRTW